MRIGVQKLVVTVSDPATGMLNSVDIELPWPPLDPQAYFVATKKISDLLAHHGAVFYASLIGEIHRCEEETCPRIPS